jgi:hypothetical protein
MDVFTCAGEANGLKPNSRLKTVSTSRQHRELDMELREQGHRPTLAQKLGDVTHVSPLLRKVRELSGCSEEEVGEWLLKCAVERGARHYEREFAEDLLPDNPALSNEELGLSGPAEMTLFGRAALARGFPGAPPGFHNTRDVDAIRPSPECSGWQVTSGNRI